MAAVNSMSSSRLPLGAFPARAVLMYRAAVGEGAVALQLREATPAELDARLRDDRLALCHEPELLAELLHAADLEGEHEGLSALLGAASPDLVLDASDSMPASDDADAARSGAGALGSLAGKKVRPKPTSPSRQGPQQCQVCSKIFGNASALAKHKLTHSDERKYICSVCTKAFKRQDHLNGHMLTHRNKKPYECKATGCGKSYCDARSLRRHTENHHQSALLGPLSLSEARARARSPRSPPVGATHSESSNSGSEKSSGDSSPPRTPPAATPAPAPASLKTKTRPAVHKTKTYTITLHQGQKTGGITGGAASGAAVTSNRASDVKPVECNLCHRKFKNIPALNGHMRLHGGYFKKDSDAKKLDKKEPHGPPLQTASVSVRALIEEKIISRRGAAHSAGAVTDVSRAGFVAPAPPQPAQTARGAVSPASPLSGAGRFLPPRPPTAAAAAAAASHSAGQRDSTLIELLKKGSGTKAVKRSASDPGHPGGHPGGPPASPHDYFRPDLFGVSFHSDDGYFSPALQDDAFPFPHGEDLASLEDYACVAAAVRERSPVSFPSDRRLAAVLNSPLPESLADFGACHGGSPAPPAAYPTPPASLDAASLDAAPLDAASPHTAPRASSPLSAAFFTATMSSQEEVEEALEEVLPEECGSLDAFALEPARRCMLNSEDPLLSSAPRDFRRARRPGPGPGPGPQPPAGPLAAWDQDASSLQVCVEGRDVPAVFLSPSSIPASPRRKRRASHAGPQRSRLRRARAHYTPQPMLPPDRDGTGLFVELGEGLSSSEAEGQPEPARVNVGRDFQAELPAPGADRADLHRRSEQLLWDPGINERLDDSEVRMFTELATCAAMPVGGHSREYALQTLGECGGDVRAATLRLMSRAAHPPAERWAPEEVEAFLAGLRHYDKDFFKIAALIRTKDSKQCVQFYYFWKKVTRDYKSYFLQNWTVDPQASQGQMCKGIVPSVSSPASHEGEEYPCKICGKVFNKVKSRSAHMKSHRPLDAEPKRRLEKPFEKVDRAEEPRGPRP